MLGLERGRKQPALKALVVEASQALAHLDAGRLEELTLSCQALNRDLNRGFRLVNPAERAALLQEGREAQAEMAVFARVLDATRANLSVMYRLRELRQGQLEYAAPRVRAAATESGDGDH